MREGPIIMLATLGFVAVAVTAVLMDDESDMPDDWKAKWHPEYRAAHEAKFEFF